MSSEQKCSKRHGHAYRRPDWTMNALRNATQDDSTADHAGVDGSAQCGQDNSARSSNGASSRASTIQSSTTVRIGSTSRTCGCGGDWLGCGDLFVTRKIRNNAGYWAQHPFGSRQLMTRTSRNRAAPARAHSLRRRTEIHLMAGPAQSAAVLVTDRCCITPATTGEQTCRRLHGPFSRRASGQ